MGSRRNKDLGDRRRERREDLEVLRIRVVEEKERARLKEWEVSHSLKHTHTHAHTANLPLPELPSAVRLQGARRGQRSPLPCVPSGVAAAVQEVSYSWETRSKTGWVFGSSICSNVWSLVSTLLS